MSKEPVAVKPVEQREWRLRHKIEGWYWSQAFYSRSDARYGKSREMIHPPSWQIIPVIISPAPRKAKKK